MKSLLKILTISFALCSCCEASEKEFILARITYYTGPKTASGKKPVQGVTVAAERKYKFGHTFYIPELKNKVGGDGTFKVMDRGPAVQSRKASRGKLPVIDVYVSSQAKVNKFGRDKKNIIKIYKSK